MTIQHSMDITVSSSIDGLELLLEAMRQFKSEYPGPYNESLMVMDRMGDNGDRRLNCTIYLRSPE